MIKHLWLAEKALEKRNWEKCIQATDKLHQKGYILDRTRFWRGTALLQLGRDKEALADFNKIKGRLDTINEESSRHWNHALALYRTGQNEEACELLMEKINPDWPTNTFWKARQFLADAGYEAFRVKV